MIFLESEIDRQKRKTRNARQVMIDVLAEVDCGRHLVSVISSRYSHAEREFEKTMARLREIDPTCPGYTGHD